MVSIGATGAAHPGGEEQRGQLDGAEMEADEDRSGRRTANASVDDLGCLDKQALVEVRRADGGRPRDLEVVAGVVPERRAHEALERARVGRGRADRATATTLLGEGDADPAQVSPRLGRAVRRQAVPEVAGRDGEADLRTFREVADAATTRRSGPARGRGGRCRSSGRPGIHGRRPGPGPVDRPA